MATRATYQIDGTVFYCHWDGYPTGAAQRFAKMIGALTVPLADDDERRGIDSMQDRRGGMAYAFIRGNMDAEPTGSHDEHGDTDFQYALTINEKSGKALIEVRQRGRDDRYNVNHVLDLAAWLNDMRGELARQIDGAIARAPKRMDMDRRPGAAQALEAIPVIVRVSEQRETWDSAGRRFTYATLDAARAITARLRAQGEAFGKDNPNGPAYLARAGAWDKATTEEVQA